MIFGNPTTDDFGRQCLLARRLSESGVRFLQVNDSNNSTTPKWDQHRDLKKEHEAHVDAVDMQDVTFDQPTWLAM